MPAEFKRFQNISKIHPLHLKRFQLKTEYGRRDGSVHVFKDLPVPLRPYPGDYSIEGASHMTLESLRDMHLLKPAFDESGNV